MACGKSTTFDLVHHLICESSPSGSRVFITRTCNLCGGAPIGKRVSGFHRRGRVFALRYTLNTAREGLGIIELSGRIAFSP